MNIKNWKTPWNVSRERRLYFHSTFTFLIYIGSAFFFFRGSTLYYIIAAHNSTKETHQLHTILSGYFYFILMMTDDKCMSLNWIQNALSSQNVVDIILLIWLWLDFDEMRWCFRYGMEKTIYFCFRKDELVLRYNSHFMFLVAVNCLQNN